MAKKSVQERHEYSTRYPGNLYVTPLNTNAFPYNFLQIQQTGNGVVYLGINVPDNNDLGYEIHWMMIDPDVLDELLVALSYAKHVVENRT